MNKKEYFEFLKKHLPRDKYRERYLEELEDHYEDALYVETFGKNAAQDRVLTRLGNPEQTVFYYKQLMQKTSMRTPYLEALFAGIISSPLYLLLFFANSWTESTELLIGKMTLFFFGSLALVVAFYIFYRAIFSKLKPLNDLLSVRGKLGSFFCTLLPGFIFGLSSLYTFYFIDYQDRYFPLVILAYQLLICFSAWKAFQDSFQRPWSLPGQWSKHLLVLLLFVLLFFSEPGEVFLFFLKVFWTVFSGGDVSFAVLSSGVSLVLLALFCLYSLPQWFKNRKGDFPLLKLGVLLSVVYALLLPSFKPTQNSEVLEWSLPHRELTQTLEQRHFGLFYEWSLKFRNDDGPFFQLALGSGKDAPFTFNTVSATNSEFYIHMQTIADYRLVANDLDDLTLELLDTDPNEFYPEDPSILDERLTCVLSELAAEAHEGVEESPLLGGETDCKELYFEGQLIYANPTDHWVMLQDAVFSSDNNWLLLQFHDTYGRSDGVYLIEL